MRRRRGWISHKIFNMDGEDKQDKFLPAILYILYIDVKNFKKSFALPLRTLR